MKKTVLVVVATAVLVVLASDVYDPSEYIKDYNEFLTMNKS